LNQFNFNYQVIKPCCQPYPNPLKSSALSFFFPVISALRNKSFNDHLSYIVNSDDLNFYYCR